DYLQFYGEEGPAGPSNHFTPVQLTLGFSDSRQAEIKRLKTRAILNLEPAGGPFPVIVVGQGLYYESPVTHVLLCEYLASHGFLVAASPLKGTHSQLSNLSVPDLETQVRDMELTLAQAAALPFADRKKMAVIGYDLGGMSGLILTMRNPAVSAFLSLDSGILHPHSSGLPGNHPSYDERRFTQPWMHVIQSRFIQPEKDSTLKRKRFGDSYLAGVPVSNHGAFTLYAALGIENPVPGFWEEPEPNLQETYESICRLALTFFDGYLRGNPKAIHTLRTLASISAPDTGEIRLEFSPGSPQTIASEGELIDLVINQGYAAASPRIEAQLASSSGQEIFSEKSLTWLGYHFLYWWGRPGEAIDVFALTVRLFPNSPDAYSGYARAFLANDQTEEARQALGKCLELDPGNEYAEKMLAQLNPTSEAKPE
ncbi:MAG: tetratricopeptide repeat protein, partial [Acidobacteriota bacterium]